MKAVLIKSFQKFSYAVCIVAVIFVGLAFTQIPYWAYYGLAVTEDCLDEDPNYIVVMGGDGMPSPSGLMQTYYGVEKARIYPQAKIILALPYNEFDSSRQLQLMAHEFVIKGIDTNRIIFEPHGFNTRSQVEQIDSIIPNKDLAILVVSSPEHMFRCLASFRKIGFTNVGGQPTFEKPSDEEKLKDKTKDGRKRVRNLALRYNVWSYMQYEITVLREYTAIVYYWLMGWI